MPLESLLELVETLSARIEWHTDALRQSEALTRYALIDPLLRELGWDTADPDIVIPAYRSGNGRADYALIHNGSPVMMVEAKSLDTSLEQVLSQGIQYCLELGTKFFCVTDGRIWEIYETHKPVPISDKRIVQFDLKNDDPAQVCLQALALWRPSVETGNVNAAQSPVLTPSQPQPSIREAEPSSVPTPNPQPTPVAPVSENDKWLPLSQLNPSGGDKARFDLMLPDSTTVQIRNWKAVMVGVATWLVGENLLRPDHCPVQTSSARIRCIANTIPIHPNGMSFYEDVQVGPLHIETNVNSQTAVNNARLLIERAGQDPAQFKVSI